MERAVFSNALLGASSRQSAPGAWLAGHKREPSLQRPRESAYSVYRLLYRYLTPYPFPVGGQVDSADSADSARLGRDLAENNLTWAGTQPESCQVDLECLNDVYLIIKQ